MRRIRKFLSELSLTQQLVTIVVLTFVFFTLFFFGSISFNIDRFVDRQMFDLVHASQQNVIYSYQLGLEDPELFGAYEPNIIHVIYSEDEKFISNNAAGLSKELWNQIQYELGEPLALGSQDFYGYDRTIYTISKIPGKDATIATLITRTYKTEFKKLLLQNVINIILILIGVVFLLLLMWVSMIIHPLNQVMDYINKIRKGEKAELKIHRKDEIGALANVLVELNEELIRQEKLKEEMIQNISHDLKTPIATIKSYAESIKDGVYPYQTLEKSVDVIIEHADRLEKKVFNLLMLNRMDYLSSDSNHDSYLDLQEIVEQVIVSSILIRPEIEIDLKVDGSRMYGSEEPWRVVIENLIDNALRFAKSRIEIRLENDKITVYNDGSAIDEASVQSLFNAYEKGKGGQFGLGLAIVHRVVTNYYYHVYVENVADGVMFTIERGDKNGSNK